MNLTTTIDLHLDEPAARMLRLILTWQAKHFADCIAAAVAGCDTGAVRKLAGHLERTKALIFTLDEAIAAYVTIREAEAVAIIVVASAASSTEGTN